MRKYDLIAVLLYAYGYEWMKECPHKHDFRSCEKFVEKIRDCIDPYLKEIHIQLECKINTGTIISPVYTKCAYTRSLYDLTREWEVQWVHLFSILKEGDDFLDVLLLWIFSGPWRLKEPGNIIKDPCKDLLFDDRCEKVMSLSCTKLWLKPKERTHSPPPGAIYVPPSALTRLLNKINEDKPCTLPENPTPLSYFHRDLDFGDVRQEYTGSNSPDIPTGGLFEELIMCNKLFSFWASNRNGKGYFINAYTFDAFKSLDKDQQVCLFQLWKKDQTEERLIRIIATMYGNLYSGGRGGRNRC
jgi:hypothetical protein